MRKAPLGWLPWVALLLLGLLGLGAFLVARNVGDAGDQAGVDVTDDRAAAGQDPPGPDANRADGPDSGSRPDASRATAAPAAGATTPTTSAAPTAPAAPAAGATSSAAGGSLNAGGQPILPLPAAGLASLTGRPVEGLNVCVESVVGDESFWVGDDTTNRVLVFLTPQARTRSGESPFQVTAGQRVRLTGALRPLPADVSPFGVDAREGADQLRQQGQFVEATNITLS